MHLFSEIYQALLIYLQRTLNFLGDYVRALIGGKRATLLVRLGTAIGVIGGLAMAAGHQLTGIASALVTALAGGVLSMATLLIIVAFPQAKRFWGAVLLLAASTLVVLHFTLLHDPGLLILAAAMALIALSAFFIDDRYLCGSIRGTMAEWRVTRVLSRLAGRNGGLINNGVFQSGASTTEIDHILINQAGVFVVETKGLSGVVLGSQEQDVWRQILTTNITHEFKNPVIQNEIHVRAIQRLVGEDIPVHNVVVFTNAKFSGGMPSNVVRLSELARYLKTFKFKALNESMIRTLVARIQGSMDKSREARDAHILRVSERRLSEYAD